jgi:hypothetical protein
MTKGEWIEINPDDPTTWPEETVSVIVATFDGSVYGDYRPDSWEHGSDKLVWEHSGEYGTEVIAWMENPKHPLEDGE